MQLKNAIFNYVEMETSRTKLHRPQLLLFISPLAMKTNTVPAFNSFRQFI